MSESDSTNIQNNKENICQNYNSTRANTEIIKIEEGSKEL